MIDDAVFKALAEPTRRRILQVLSTNELVVSELVEVLQLPQSTVSRHLKVLREAGLVQARSSGTATLYALRSVELDERSRADGGQTGWTLGDDAKHQSPALAAGVVGWCQSQPLGNGVQRRLESVLDRRRSESADFFGRLAHRWDQLRVDCFGSVFHLEALTALLPREWTVLDVGAGTGYLLPALAGAFERVIAVDPAAEMLAVAQRRVASAGLGNVQLHQSSATDLPVATSGVDLCLASLVLHHEPAPGDALREFARVVKPGGRLMLIEQHTHRLDRFHDLMQDRRSGFDPAELSRQVADTGFDAVATRMLETAESTSGSAPEAPPLFVLTAYRSHAPVRADCSRKGTGRTRGAEPGGNAEPAPAETCKKPIT